MTDPLEAELISSLVLRIGLNPVVILTVLAPALFAAARDRLLAFKAEMPMKGAENKPWVEFVNYVTKPNMVPYINYVGGLYALAGGWIALCVLTFQLALKIERLDVASVAQLPATQSSLQTWAWIVFGVVAGSFVYLVLTVRTFTKADVVRSFWEHHGRFVPPLNRIFWARLLLVVVALALLGGEIFWLRLR